VAYACRVVTRVGDGDLLEGVVCPQTYWDIEAAVREYHMPRLLRRTCAGVVLVLALVLLERGARADPPSQDIAALSAQVEQLWSARKYAEALSAQEKALAATEKAERASSGKPGVATGSALHNVAFYALFARHHSRALAASERARKLAPNELSIETNQAHALMFLGRLQAARNLYRAHQNKRFPSGSLWQDEIEDDFIKLTDAGLGHSLMPIVLQELGSGSLEPGLSGMRCSSRHLS